MSRVSTVPRSDDGGDQPDLLSAWRLLRSHGMVRVSTGAVSRFRDGDGYSHSRALALQLALAVIPFLLALTGLAAALHEHSASVVLAQSIAAVSPGGSSRDALAAGITRSEGGGVAKGGFIALAVGLVVSFGAATVSMGQVERGANRIFGEHEDRPFLAKYRRAAGLTLVIGPLAGAGFMLLIAGGPFATAATAQFHWNDGVRIGFDIARWPLGLLVLIAALTLLIDRAPARRQPMSSWLLVGSLTAVVITAVVTSVFAAYLRLSGTFGQTYGPLAGVMALLIWSLSVSVALFYGFAACAELESLHRVDGADQQSP